MKHLLIALATSSILTLATTAGTTTVPDELETKVFADASMTPCPAVISATPYGDLFVGVDMQGSLGKKPNLGYIAKLSDTDNDGKADKRTVFAKVDNPRGLVAIGNKLIVLHCIQKDGVIHTQQLSVFNDNDNDGVADGPAKPLITNIGNPKFLKSRGTDHSTNNIRLGIDGWIYISIGDFGFVDAQGTDGTKLSMHGGGIVRVRPDGSEMETFIHGTRNVYDVAIDPFMNVVTRENTNDGIGWWIRFSHYIQSGEYGYPSLYTNFPEDILPALGEYGGGSGCRSHIYIHRVTKDGASFTDKPEDFIGCAQVTDIDSDASGRMYLSAWDGAGYKGNPDKGYISIVTPKGWVYKEFPELSKLSASELVNLLKTASSTARVYAQQEILHQNNSLYIPLLKTLIANKAASNESRVAALFTITQLAHQLDTENNLLPLLQTLILQKENPVVREQAIRAFSDRLSSAKKAPEQMLHSIQSCLNDSEPRVQVASAIALGRIKNIDSVNALIKKAVPPAPKTIKVDKTLLDKAIEIKGGQKVEIDVDISTFKKLYLIANDAGDNTNDQVAWINPTVHQKFDQSTDMTEHKWKSATQGKGKTLVNKTAYGKPLPNGAKGIGTHANSIIEFKLPNKSVTFTATGILTNPQGKGSAKFIVSNSANAAKPSNQPKLHSTPHKEIILPHVAMQALLAIDAQEGCIAALSSSNESMQRGALAAMKFMHSDKVVDALIAAAERNTNLKPLIINTLIRLHQKEVDYDGSTWWQTRPDPKGPYFYPTDWSGTAKISNFINTYYATLEASAQKTLITELKKNKAYIVKLNPRPEEKGQTVATVGKTSIEDIVLHVGKHKGNSANGAKVINKVGCIACHGVKAGDPIKGPDLANLGKMSDVDLAEAIIKPGATIAPSWVTVTMNDESGHVGTIVKKDEKELTLHNIGGIPTILDASQISKTEPGPNMMSLHLCDNLTLNEFSDLLAYIKSLDTKKDN